LHLAPPLGNKRCWLQRRKLEIESRVGHPQGQLQVIVYIDCSDWITHTSQKFPQNFRETWAKSTQLNKIIQVLKNILPITWHFLLFYESTVLNSALNQRAGSLCFVYCRLILQRKKCFTCEKLTCIFSQSCQNFYIHKKLLFFLYFLPSSERKPSICFMSIRWQSGRDSWHIFSIKKSHLFKPSARTQIIS
jgi:hypothetical protein